MTLRDAYVEKLEQENEDLRAHIRDLEEQLGFKFECPPQFCLTVNEAKIFGLLLKKPLVTKEFAISAIYLHKQDEAEIKIIDVWVCKIRRKLKPFGIVVETVWGQGFRMSTESRAIAEALLAEANELHPSKGAAA